MLQPGKDTIILKLQMKQNVIIIARDNDKRADAPEIDRAFVAFVGENVTLVKPGDEVILVPRPFMRLPLEKYIGVEEEKHVWYTRCKEEDIIAVVSL